MKLVNKTSVQQVTSDKFFDLKVTINLEGTIAENQERMALSFAAKDLAYNIREFVVNAFEDVSK